MCDMTHSYVWRVAFIFVTRRSYMCDMTHTHVWHDAFICVTWRIHMCDMIHSYMWHDTIICVTWLIHMRDMTHSCASCLTYSKELRHTFKRVTSHSHTAAVTNETSDMCNTHKWVMSHTFKWVMWHIQMSHVSQAHSCSLIRHAEQTWMNHVSHVRMSHVTHLYESCDTFKWVMSHRLTGTLLQSHTKHLTCGTRKKWVMSQTFKWVMSHTFKWVMSHRHTAAVSNETFDMWRTVYTCSCWIWWGPNGGWLRARGSWIVQMCDMTHSRVCPPRRMTSCAGFVDSSNVWHDSFTRVPPTEDDFVREVRGLFKCVTWLIHACATHGGWVCARGSWIVQMCDMTHSRVWPSSGGWVRVRGSCRIHVCDVTDSNVYHDSFECARFVTHANVW